MEYQDIIKIQDTEEYLKQMISHGYIKEDGEPLKCECECTDFKEVPTDYIDNTVCEFNSVCKDCNSVLGNWAYGSWML